MNKENWLKVDNVSKIFLATYNERDTRSLRVSCTLNEDMDPYLLGNALRKTISARNIFQVRIRRGVFWHYIEHTDDIPEVSEEHGRPCPLLYGKNFKGGLHYKVTYYYDKINLDIFHALTDGTGALEFLNMLVINYLKLKYPEKFSETFIGSGVSAGELESDSFSQYYEKGAKINLSAKKAYHIRGLKLPYDQLQFFNVKMPVKQLTDQAKMIGVSLTSYVTARLMMSIYRDMPVLKRSLPITVSIPVNLRNYYSSETSRNFFNSVYLYHVFSGDEKTDELAFLLDKQLRSNISPENIRLQMNHYQRLEHIPLLRIVPLVLKQPVIRFFTKKEAKNVSAVISNLGIMKMPEEMQEYIKDYAIYCSHNELYISMCTYNGTLTFGITTGCRNTEVLRNFITGFSKDGIEVEVNATEVIRS